MSNQNVTSDPCDIQSSFRTGADAAKVQALCAAQAAAAGSASYTYNGGVVSIPIQSGGNSLLRPEIANTWAVGAMVSPVHPLNIAVDY